MELILQKFKLFVIGFFSSIALISLSLLFGFSANADEYPNKPIEIVIHAKYGGGTDTTARMASIRSRRILKTDIRIVSKRGGAGAKAQNYVLTRPADGYTVMALTQTHLYTMARCKSNMKIDDIVDRKVLDLSLMPNGLHQSMIASDFSDLIEYLSSRK